MAFEKEKKADKSQKEHISAEIETCTCVSAESKRQRRARSVPPEKGGGVRVGLGEVGGACGGSGLGM